MKVKTYSERKTARIQKMVRDCEETEKWLALRISRLTKELAKVEKKRNRNNKAKEKYDIFLDNAKKRHLVDDAKRI